MENNPKYTVRYNPLVFKEDIPELNKDILTRIKKAIESRLQIAPEQYGSPLKRNLKGYWKLRVGDYRIIYRIYLTEIEILIIGHRKEVYAFANKRF